MNQIIESRICSRCEAKKLIEEFPWRSGGKGLSKVRSRRCLHCIRAANTECYWKHRDKRMAANLAWNAAHKEQSNAAIRAWQKRKALEGYFRTPEKKAKRRAYNASIKLEVFNAYGGSRCRCCGENIIQMLTLDHIAGDGNLQRRGMKMRSSTNMYLKLKAQGFPHGYQVLCNSCNLAKHLSGVNKCPHEIEREQLWQSFLTYVMPSGMDVLLSQAA